MPKLDTENPKKDRLKGEYDSSAHKLIDELPKEAERMPLPGTKLKEMPPALPCPKTSAQKMPTPPEFERS